MLQVVLGVNNSGPFSQTKYGLFAITVHHKALFPVGAHHHKKL
jgi:hypothetical protein